MRLSVFIAAPITAINSVIERHEHLKELFDNKWLHLFALYNDGQVSARYDGSLQWQAVPTTAEEGDQA